MKPVFSIPYGTDYHQTKTVLAELKLNTVCEETACPNRGDCWSRKSISIQVLGNVCTRACSFCGEIRGNPKGLLEADEPKRVGAACAKLGLQHIVITMPARDDLEDGGAAKIAETVVEIRKQSPRTWVEVLTSDFQGRQDSLKTVLAASPHVFAHNLETVRRLTPQVRSKATYDRSLWVLKTAKTIGAKTKSGLMLGVGETKEELQETFADLQSVGVEILTIGQYYPPSPKHHPLIKIYEKDEFEDLKKEAQSVGIAHVFSGPLIRSSHYETQIFN